MATAGYPSDLSAAQWALIKPHMPPSKPGGRPRQTDMYAVVNAIFYLLRTGCQWRLLPSDFPPWGTVWWYFRCWRREGLWVRLHRVLYPLVRTKAGRRPKPSVAIMDSQSVKTTEMGGIRGFDGHKRVKGRKRYILVDTLGLLIAKRVEPANVSDKKCGERLIAGLGSLWPTIRTVIADGGHKSKKLAAEIKRREGWRLLIVKRSECAFKITGLTWIVERTFAWLGRSRRFAKDYERGVQTSETMIDIAAVRLMINKLAPN